MGKEIMRHEKNKKQSMTQIQKHNEATEEHVKALQKHDGKNSDIVVANLRFNVDLVTPEGTYNEELKKVCKENNLKPRKDAVTCISSVYGMSPEETMFLMCRLHMTNENDTEADRRAKEKWKREHAEWIDEYKRATPEERHYRAQKEMQKVKDYAADCLKFHEEHYGKVIGAHIHMHESTPHIHIDSIPIFQDEKGVHLSAKELLGNKIKLSKMQTVFHEEVGKKYGLERGEMKVDSEIKKHTSKAQWEYDKIKKELDEKKEELEDTRQEIFEVIVETRRLKDEISHEIDDTLQKMTEDKKYAVKRQLSWVAIKEDKVKEAFEKKHPVPILFGKTKEFAKATQKLKNIVEDIEPIFTEDEDMDR